MRKKGVFSRTKFYFLSVLTILMISFVVAITSQTSILQVITTTTDIVLTDTTAEPGNFTHLTIQTNNTPYNSLVGYWNFDGDSRNVTAYDYSSNNLDGTYSTAILNQTGGIYNDFATFNNGGGAGRIFITNNAIFNFTNTTTSGFTMSLWVLNTDPNCVSSSGIWQKGDLDASTTYGLYTTALCKLTFQIKDNSSQQFGAVSNSALNDSKWHYIVGTYNTTRGINIYVDSVLQTSSNSSQTEDFSNIQNLNFGTGNAVSGRGYNGSLDEAMLFNTTLSQQQITDIYNNQSQRFFPTGNQQNKFINISEGTNLLNLTYINYERNFNSNLSTRILEWDISKGYNLSDINTSLNGLVSYWNFDNLSSLGEGSKFVVDRMGLNNLSSICSSNPNSNTALINNGVWGNARQFNATGGCLLNGSSGNMIIPANSSFTVSWWEYVSASRSASTTHLGYVNNGVWGWSVTGNNDVAWVCNVGNGTLSNSTGNAVSASLGEWHNIVCKYDKTNITLFIDNVQKATRKVTINGLVPNNLSQTRFAIGADAGANSQSINSSIDELMIFNRSLTDVERTELYVKGRALYTSSTTQNLSDAYTTYNYSADCSPSSNLMFIALNSENNTCDSLTGTKFSGASWNGIDRGIVGNLTGQFTGTSNNRYEYRDTNNFNFSNNSNTGFTIGAWFKTTKGNGFIAGTGGISTRGYNLFVNSARTVAFGFSGNITGSGTTASSTVTYGDNQWHHIVGVFNQTQGINLYVDGQFVSAVIVKPGDFSNKNNFSIGGAIFDANRQFQGSLDEVFVYNKSLTSNEIANIYTESSQIHSINQFNISTNTTNIISDVSHTADNNKFYTSVFYNQFNYIFQDTIFPLVNFTGQTQDNNSFVNNDFVYINTSITEVNFVNITYSLYNNTVLISQQIFSNTTSIVNFTGLANGDYHYQVNVTDLSGNKNSTEVRYIRLDTNAPSGELLLPSNGTYSNTSIVNFTVNSSDNLGVKNISLIISNSSGIVNSSTITNTIGTILDSIVGFVNNLGDGIYSWYSKIFDWAGNSFTTTNRTFTVDATFPSINFTYPTNSTGAELTVVQIKINVSVSDTNFVNVTVKLYNTTSLVVSNTSTSPDFLIIYDSLPEGVYFYNATTFDLAGNKNSTETRNITLRLDTIVPSITLISPVNGLNISSQSLNFSFTTIDNLAQTANCSLIIDSVIKDRNISVVNGSSTTLNASSISEGLHFYNITCADPSNNTNTSQTNNFFIDLSPPNITGLIFSPNSTDDIDPNKNVSLNTTVVDNRVNVDTVIFQYYNGTDWANNTLFTTSNNIYQTNITTLRSETNYTFNLFANDTLGNANITTNQTLYSLWDCSWTRYPADLTQIAGFDEIKNIGNISLNNTGDVQFSKSNCTLDFRFNYNLVEGRIFFNGDSIKPSNTYTLAAKVNETININASFQNEILEESLTITINEIRSRSQNLSLTTIGTLVSTTGGPYLFSSITSTPQTILLTPGNITLEGFVRNLVGDDTFNNTAFNVSLNWTLPDNFIVDSGEQNKFYENITLSTPNYNRLNLSFTAVNLPLLSPGLLTADLSAQGYNSSGYLIIHANNATILTNHVNFTLSCYNVSDGITIAACGSLDGDFVASASSGSSSSGGSGGGGGGSIGSLVSTNIDYSLVRGKENQIIIIFKNKDYNSTMHDITFTINGDIAKYIQVIPSKLSSLGPQQEMKIILNITSPSYIQLGRKEIELNINGFIGDKTYLENRIIALQINALSKDESQAMLNEIKNLSSSLKATNLSSNKLNLLIVEAEESYYSLHYEKLLENYNIIKAEANNGLEAYKILADLNNLILDSKERGIDTSNTERLLKLTEISLNRGDFNEAYLRANDAQVAYALEVKGEISKLSYYLKNNKKEISISLFLLLIFSITTYQVGKLQLIKSKIRKLKEEEGILTELIKVVQKETFNEKKMDMEQYMQSMAQYEKKITQVVEEILELEIKRVNMLRFTGETKRLQIERESIRDLIRKLQIDYLKNKKIEAKVYDLKLKSYNRRISFIDGQLASIEAKSALNGKGFLWRKRF